MSLNDSALWFITFKNALLKSSKDDLSSGQSKSAILPDIRQ